MVYMHIIKYWYFILYYIMDLFPVISLVNGKDMWNINVKNQIPSSFIQCNANYGQVYKEYLALIYYRDVLIKWSELVWKWGHPAYVCK